MAVKSRLLSFRPKQTLRYYYGGSPYNVPIEITGSQTTDSKDRPFKELTAARKGVKSGNPRYRYLTNEWADMVAGLDLGGYFYTKKNDYSEDGVVIPVARTAFGSPLSYDGPIFSRANVVNELSGTWPVLPTLVPSQVLAKGTTAISRCLPTNPAAGLGVALGELREGIPSAIGSTFLRGGSRSPRNLGSEYLNVEFGWKPLIQDVTSTARAIKDQATILAQYERDSGKFIRRRYSFPTSEVRSVHTTSNWAASPTLNSYFWSTPTGTLERTRTEVTRTWFSGCFTYFLSAGDTARSRLKKAEQQAAKLLGLRLTPELLYQLAPWSWLIDWKSNLGDVIHNVSAFANDGLVMRWGYVMSERTYTDTFRLLGPRLLGGGVPFTQTFSTVEKVRYKATPYGFGLDTAAFTPRQLAILAALGISRGPKWA